MGVDVSFDFKNVEDELRSIAKGISKVEDEVILKSAELVAEKMRQRVKRSTINRSGYRHIVDNIKISSPKTDETIGKYREIAGANKTGYKWKFLEYGTTKMDARPFMKPSVDETETERKRIAENALRRVVE